jgi:hypothetical protein
VARTTPVRVVLRGRCKAKIAPSIVCGIAVAVIDHRPAPSVHHVEPCELMGRVMALADPDHPIPLAVEAAGELVLVDVRRLFAPAKFSRSLIVAQQLAQPRAGQSCTSFQRPVRKMKKGREAALAGKWSEFEEDRSSAGPFWTRPRRAGRHDWRSLHFGSLPV